MTSSSDKNSPGGLAVCLVFGLAFACVWWQWGKAMPGIVLLVILIGSLSLLVAVAKSRVVLPSSFIGQVAHPTMF